VLAFVTGRPASIPEDIIEIPLPMDENFFPDPARNHHPAASVEAVEAVPFNQVVRLMCLCGRISNILNGRRGRLRTLVGIPESAVDGLAKLQTDLVHFYHALPESMRWSVEGFKHQESRGHGVRLS
jgi:hypothetical protein